MGLLKSLKNFFGGKNSTNLYTTDTAPTPTINPIPRDILQEVDFTIKHSSLIKKFENNLVQNTIAIRGCKNIDEEIILCKDNIKIFYEFKDFCVSKGSTGQKYFSGMWEHCHNSYNLDFSYIANTEERLEYLTQNYVALTEKQKKITAFQIDGVNILLKAISDNEDILQKNIYKLFDPDLKDSIKDTLYSMEKNGLISRQKSGNSYKLFKI